MVHVTFGEKGAGNSKNIIELANGSLEETTGSVVFIDAEGQYLFELKHAIRFVDASQYRIDTPQMFYGFLVGIASQDFDLQRIYVDGIGKIVNASLEDMQEMFENINELSEKSKIEVYIAVSGTGNMPEYLKKYTV